MGVFAADRVHDALRQLDARGVRPLQNLQHSCGQSGLLAGADLGGTGFFKAARLLQQRQNQRHADVFSAQSLLEVQRTGIVVHLRGDLVDPGQRMQNLSLIHI